ncbi:UNVERIFIED_CONTAM: hypothetical protein BEN50_16785 [Euhalothece sp. KZN 001]
MFSFSYLPQTFPKDENLPNYVRDEFENFAGQLEFVGDIWEGKWAWFDYLSLAESDPVKSHRYLPFEVDETVEEYNLRLSRSHFYRFFRASIEVFSGFLSDFNVREETPDQIKALLENVDGKGNNLQTFLRLADEKALRDGHCYILVDYPQVQPRNAREERELGARPYLSLIDRRNIKNWLLNPSETEIEQVTITEQIKVQSGNFGVASVTQYRVITPNRFEVWRLDQNEPILVESGEISLRKVPIVCYSCSASQSHQFESELPLIDLAETNLKHYQRLSDYIEKEHAINMPVLVVQELERDYDDPLAPDSQDKEGKPEIKLGSRSALWNLEAKFIEPQATSLQESRISIKNIEENIEKRTLTFLTTTEAPKTATEIAAFTSPTKANFQTMADAKENNTEQIFRLLGEFLGLSPRNVVGGISVNRLIIEGGLSVEESRLLLEMQRNGQITLKTLLKNLIDGKKIKLSSSIQDEIDMIGILE